MGKTAYLEKPLDQENSTVNPSAVSDETLTSLDILDQFLKPEVQQSMTVLIEYLPKLTEMVTVLTKAYDLSQSLLTDRVLIEDLTGGLQEFVKPVQEKAKHLAAAAIEANEQAELDQTPIGLFGILKMLKDPQVQHMFRFLQNFLNILNQRK
jgi:uncharacterized protein YjgD (DUF1641 family)